jgi:hypothetical protein
VIKVGVLAQYLQHGVGRRVGVGTGGVSLEVSELDVEPLPEAVGQLARIELPEDSAKGRAGQPVVSGDGGGGHARRCHARDVGCSNPAVAGGVADEGRLERGGEHGGAGNVEGGGHRRRVQAHQPGNRGSGARGPPVAVGVDPGAQPGGAPEPACDLVAGQQGRGQIRARGVLCLGHREGRREDVARGVTAGVLVALVEL